MGSQSGSCGAGLSRPVHASHVLLQSLARCFYRNSQRTRFAIKGETPMLSFLHATTPRFYLALTLLLAVPLAANAAGDGARVVKYGPEDVIPVRAKLRFSTLIVLPDNEEIL